MSRKREQENLLPTQGEIDGVALYISTSRQLRACRFFLEEHHILSLSWTAGARRDQISAHLPDQETVLTAVVHFRKIWMQREPCHYRKVANTIKRYHKSLGQMIDFSMLKHGGLQFIPPLGKIELKPEDAIDIWMNTELMHAGSSKCRKFDRNDFKRWKDELGQALFEYYFQNSLWCIGHMLINFLPVVEEFLKWCDSHGCRSGIDVSSAPSPGNIVRSTPGFEMAKNAGEEIVWRLRRRKKYENFSTLLDPLQLSDSRVLELVRSCGRFEDFCESIDIKLEKMDNLTDINVCDCLFSRAAIDMSSTYPRTRNGRFVMTRSQIIKWSGEWLELVSEHYAAFRGVLLEGDLPPNNHA